MRIEIDKNSGCCHGVLRAIERAEEYLDRYSASTPTRLPVQAHPAGLDLDSSGASTPTLDVSPLNAEDHPDHNGTLYSLGAIVHNNTEIHRLNAKGLKIIDYDTFSSLHDCTVLIRAHGEPPATYAIAKKNRLHLIDCTCPVVLRLQKKIAETYDEMKRIGGRIMIFGKSGHAEVNGLVGQTDGTALVIENIKEIDALVKNGTLDLSRPIVLFSQTTKDPKEYEALCNYLKSITSDLRIFNTICRQVSSRHPHLMKFAAEHSVILFVSGRESSNGKILFELCRSVNPRTHLIENPTQIDPLWLHPDDFVGICGATSTPRWQLEEAAKLEKNVPN